MNPLFRTFFVLLFFTTGCGVSKNFTPHTKYAPEVLQQDYHVFKNILEQEHPSLYWYTPKDTIDQYFERGSAMLKDSLTEIHFRNVLSSVISKINCGHTSVRASKKYERMRDSIRLRPFPLGLKVWPDTAVVTYNLNRKDSAIMRGAIITAIDGRPMHQIVDSLFNYLPADGYNLTHKYQSLSNRGMFSSLYTSVFGYKPSYNISFIDTAGLQKDAVVSLFRPVKDNTAQAKQLPRPRPTRREIKKFELGAARSFRIDTALRAAFMDLNTFTKDAKLRRFFKKSFKKLRKNQISHLVIDLRGNGGGSVTYSNLLSRYIATKPFKIADSLFAIARTSKYGKYEQHRFLHSLFLFTMTRRRKDGHFHFPFYEKKRFHPKTNNHYNGHVYILTGGNTFSASTLFIKTVLQQDNITIVGEETGGGAYGNSAWLIPEVTLPNTGVRFRLPVFRLVIDKNATKGWGVVPMVPALPTVNAIRQNRDYKMEAVRALIKQARH